MITVETQPRGRGHRDDGHEEEIQQADNDTKKKKVTNKHHQMANPANKVMQFLTDLKSNGWRLTEFAKSLLLGARRERAT